MTSAGTPSVDRDQVTDDIARLVEADIPPDSLVGHAIERLRIAVPLLLARAGTRTRPELEVDELLATVRRASAAADTARLDAALEQLRAALVEARRWARAMYALEDVAQAMGSPPGWLAANR